MWSTYPPFMKIYRKAKTDVLPFNKKSSKIHRTNSNNTKDWKYYLILIFELCFIIFCYNLKVEMIIQRRDHVLRREVTSFHSIVLGDLGAIWRGEFIELSSFKSFIYLFKLLIAFKKRLKQYF